MGDLLRPNRRAVHGVEKDGEVVERGPYGVSAIDPSSGNTLALSRRRQGITNVALVDASTALVADRDELIAIDASNGKAVNV